MPASNGMAHGKERQGEQAEESYEERKKRPGQQQQHQPRPWADIQAPTGPRSWTPMLVGSSHWPSQRLASDRWRRQSQGRWLPVRDWRSTRALTPFQYSLEQINLCCGAVRHTPAASKKIGVKNKIRSRQFHSKFLGISKIEPIEVYSKLNNQK